MDQRSKIAVLGYGIEGKAMVKYLLAHAYFDVTICDRNVDLGDEIPDGVSTILGANYLENLTDFDVIFRSPGIKYLEPAIQFAKENGAEISSPMAFFVDICPCRMVGITGTKGKGTTATLIYEMLKNEGVSAYLGGNIGESPMDFLDNLTKDSVVVLELSSFQLQDMIKSPHVAVILNTTIDHLDYHADKDEYLRAKESILAHQNKDCLAILNKDYEYVKYYNELVKGEVKFVSVHKKVEDGAFVKDGEIFYAEYGDVEKVCDLSDIALVGKHNFENVLPAICAAKEFGVPFEVMKETIKSFTGLPHRLEFVKEVDSVKYYNDSFSTTPETSMAAVDSFDVPTVLIAGGFDKGLHYKDWALKVLLKPNLEVVILLGHTADRMEQDLSEAEEKLGEAQGSPTKILRVNNIHEAVVLASKEAKKGGIVVMSPGSSSFDLYANYKERGKKFMEEVKGL
ncbi:MAG: UDP-N-acetylmuramoyl-L-alanine--D-glutamate ligase [Candidatus Peregrinibacteria bacterium]|nr:UDP-N-acetylmuramoyl-L-alanine--D-glutamate ligase [Candidatus Peregrinibacteria bacterium]